MGVIHQTIIDNFDHVIYENGNAYISLRKVKWSEDSDPKLDLRRYVTKPDGGEQMMKGCSFNDDAANELTNVLIEEGYGDTRTCVENLQQRDDFMESLAWAMSDNDKDKMKELFPDIELPDVSEEEENFIDIREELMEG